MAFHNLNFIQCFIFAKKTIFMKGLFDKKYSIRLIYLIFVFLALTFCAVFIGLKFGGHWKTSVAVDYTTKITIAIIAFLTLMYHAHNLENQIKTQEDSNKQNLAKYTYDICAEFRKTTMMQVNEDIRCLVKAQSDNLEKHNIKQFVQYIEDPKNKDQRMALVLTLNYFEGVSVMVLAGDLDTEIVKKLFGKLFGRYYVKLQHYIDHRQLEAARSWINFEKLSKKWIEEEKS